MVTYLFASVVGAGIERLFAAKGMDSEPFTTAASKLLLMRAVRAGSYPRKMRLRA